MVEKDLQRYNDIHYNGKVDDREDFVSFLYHNSEASPFEPDTEKAWSAIKHKLVEQSGVNIRPFAAAASVILVLGLALFIYLSGDLYSPNKLTVTAETEVLEYQLPDGSLVTLSPQSSISFEENFKQREVIIEGKGFFDVTNNQSPFVVEADKSQIVVLGTSFQVSNLDTELKVYVREGIVQYQDKVQKIRLVEGNGISYSKVTGELTTDATADVNQTAWLTGKLQFDEAPMNKVISTVEDYFKVSIEVSNRKIAKCTFTGTFDDPNLTEVLNALSDVFGLEVIKKPNNYLLKGQGC